MKKRSSCFLAALLFVSFSVHGIEDPTLPQLAQAQNTQRLLNQPELSSILFSTDRRWAVINGEVLTEGERINGFTVSAIERHRVVLVRNDKSLQLSLNKEGFGGTDI